MEMESAAENGVKETVTFSFAGCLDAQGHPVASRADATLQVLVATSLEGDQRVILYNPSLLPQLLPETRAFLFAHECGRTYLKQPLGARTTEQVRQADCWAVDTLLRSRLLKDSEGVSAIESDLSMLDAQRAQLSAHEHAYALTSCPATKAGTRGTGNVLQLDGKTASPAWNVCTQRCGAVLYQCGRSDSCTASFDRCVTGCNTLR